MATNGNSGRAALWLLLALPALGAGGWALGHFTGGDVPPAVVQIDPETRAAGERRLQAMRNRSSEEAARLAAAAAREPAPTPAQPYRAPGERSNWTTYDRAVEESRRTGKPILIDFTAEWCPPCQMMQRSVFDDANLGDAVRLAVVPVSIVDRMREDGGNLPEVEALQKRHHVSGFPTLVVLNPASGRMQSTAGYGGPEYTLDWIQWAAESVR